MHTRRLISAAFAAMALAVASVPALADPPARSRASMDCEIALTLRLVLWNATKVKISADGDEITEVNVPATPDGIRTVQRMCKGIDTPANVSRGDARRKVETAQAAPQ